MEGGGGHSRRVQGRALQTVVSLGANGARLAGAWNGVEGAGSARNGRSSASTAQVASRAHTAPNVPEPAKQAAVSKAPGHQ